MDISVIIPSLDEEKNLARLIPQLNQAGIPASSVYVADGGSRDASVRVCRRHRVHLVLKGGGRGPQLHAAALSAMERHPDLLLFLHADSHVRPGMVAQLEAAFADPGPRFACFSSAIQHPGRVYRLMEAVINRRTDWTRVPYGDQGLALRPGLYRWCGGYPAWPLFEEVGLSSLLRRCATFIRMGEGMATSPRRWEKGGPALVTMRNWGIMSAYLLGVSPHTLARFYAARGKRRGRD